MTTFTEELTEFIDQADAPLDNFPVIAEVPAMSESVSSIGTFNETSSEALTVLDEIRNGWQFTISDSATASETILLELSVLVQEVITLTGLVIASGTFNETVSDLILTLGLLFPNNLISDTLTETPALADTVAQEYFLLLTLKEILDLSETVSAVGDISVEVTETLSVIDAVLRSFLESVSDSISTAESVIFLLTLKSLISDAASALELVVDIGNLNHAILEEPSATDAASSIGSFFEIVIDTSTVFTRVILDGEVYQCWVLTTDEFKISSYTNFNFNSFATIDNQLFGAKEDGVYKINSADSDDAGVTINTGVQFNLEALQDLHKKRFRKAYIGSEGTNTVLKIEDDAGNTRYYALNRKQVTVGKDLQQRRYKFALRSITEIDHIDFHPILLDKNR